MASNDGDQKPEILEKMREEPLSEAEVDELRASGRGFEREAQDTPEARRAHGGNEPHASHRSLNASEGSPTRGFTESGDESSVARQRAEGRFESEGERTQLEEDFGERGLRMPDHADTSNTPSILDPDVE